MRNPQFDLTYRTVAALVVVGVLALASLPAANATALSPPNFGFESGNFTGWTTYVPPGAAASVVSSYTGTITGTTVSALYGAKYAMLKTDGPGSYTSVSRSISATAGDTLTGAAFFKAEDYPPYNDNAQVVIKQGSTTLATLFQSSVNQVGAYGSTGWKTYTYTFPSTGTFTFEARIANSGDSSLDSFMGIDSAAVADTTPPVVSASTSVAPNANGWNNGAVTVSFSATDAGGVKEIKYTVGGGSTTTVSGASASTTLSAEGVHDVQYWAVDNAGNTAAAQSLSVKIDTTAPSISAASSPAANGAGWNNEPVTTSFSCSDALSGIDACASSVETSVEGTTTVTGSATDLAGNTASASTTVKIDMTAPSCTSSPDPASLWPPNHKMIDVSLVTSTNDALSGVASFVLASAASDEADNGLGDGDKPNDIQGFTIGSNDVSGSLRAERAGNGDGRVYTLGYSVTDEAGNSASCSGSVTVPHSQ